MSFDAYISDSLKYNIETILKSSKKTNTKQNKTKKQNKTNDPIFEMHLSNALDNDNDNNNELLSN